MIRVYVNVDFGVPVPLSKWGQCSEKQQEHFKKYHFGMIEIQYGQSKMKLKHYLGSLLFGYLLGDIEKLFREKSHTLDGLEPDYNALKFEPMGDALKLSEYYINNSPPEPPKLLQEITVPKYIFITEVFEAAKLYAATVVLNEQSRLVKNSRLKDAKEIIDKYTRNKNEP